MEFLINYWWIILLVLLLTGCFVTINQGFIGVVTMFGKYRRILRPGLNFKIPFLEQIYKKLSIQNRSVELEFQHPREFGVNSIEIWTPPLFTRNGEGVPVILRQTVTNACSDPGVAMRLGIQAANFRGSS